ncbi:MAG: MFS transporter [Ktedonobacterales bacterium]
MDDDSMKGMGVDTLDRQEEEQALAIPETAISVTGAAQGYEIAAEAPPNGEMTPPAGKRDPYAALRHSDFRLLMSGRFVAAMGEQMLYVAIGWELYERTHSALALGLVGLAQVSPIILLTLLAGHVADRFDRRIVSLISAMLLLLGALGLAALSYTQGPLPLIYGCLVLIGISDAFGSPANTALLSQTIPMETFSNAATWSSSAWQLASVIGPALGGLLIAVQHRASFVYVLDALAALIFITLLSRIQSRPAPRRRETATVQSLVAGAGFVWRTKVILAAITLDLFAVLLGGAVTLLPIYADLLHVGAVGLGLMRAAPSVGAVTMALAIAFLPPFKHAGRTLLIAVAGFGAATIIFGLSHSFALSLLVLVMAGGLDNISVVIRSTLLLVRTPDAMRGRISAVNSLFIGASNELGGFESGVAAAIFGPVIAVVSGGVGTILVVLAVALIWPEMRRLGRLAPEVEHDNAHS